MRDRLCRACASNREMVSVDGMCPAGLKFKELLASACSLQLFILDPSKLNEFDHRTRAPDRWRGKLVSEHRQVEQLRAEPH